MTTANVIKKASLAIAGSVVMALGTLSMGQAQAVVATFDDLPNTIDWIPNGYQGFNWNNFAYVNPVGFGLSGTGYDYGTVSSPNVAFNNAGNPASVSVASGQFDFKSAYLTGAWRNGLNILVEGFLGGVSKYSQTVTVNSTSPTKFSFNYLGIDNLRFTSSGGVNAGYGSSNRQFALDNFEAAPVPEPTTMLGSLVVGGFLVNRSRKNKNLKASTKV